MQHKSRVSRGFTIVELLVVIVVVGILATLVIVAFTGIQQQARVAALKADLSQASRSLELYKVKSSTEQYPAGIDCSSTPAVDTICIKSSDGSAFQYSPTPSSYCVTVTKGSTSYYNDGSDNPQPGACSGHIVSGVYGSLPVASSIEGYWSTAPQGFLFEDGSAVSRAIYAELFATIGTTYGAGDGSTTFNLPDSRGRTAVNVSASDTEFNVVGKKYGAKTHVLLLSELPSHSHLLRVKNPGTATYGETGGGDASATSGDRTGVVRPEGGGQSHNNTQPSITKVFAIKYSPPDSGAATLPAGTSIRGYWSSMPNGYLAEDGAAVSRSSYGSLYTAIGITYGAGDGSTTFNLPDSRGRAMVNQSPSDIEFDTLGEKYGEKAHTLTIAEMPSHSHQLRVKNPGTATYGETGGGDASGTSGDRAGVVRPEGGGQPHNNIQPSIALTYAIKHAAATGTGKPVETGTSVQGYWTTTPSGYLPENGAAVSRTTYAELFTVIGTTYGGGDGSTTFNVPNSRGRIAVNRSVSDSEFVTIGQLYGNKTEILTIAQMPAHAHQLRVKNPGTVTYGEAAAGDASATSGDRAGVVRPEGGGQPHNNIQPSIVKSFVIKF